MKITFRHILINFRVNVDDDEIIKNKNVYNQIAKLKKKISKNLTSIKAFFNKIYSCDFWFVKHYCKIEVKELKKLFFAYLNYMMMMICNWKIFFIDIIYKFNQYRMSLCVIIKIIALNITFCVEFAFISNENSIIYKWILKQIIELYKELNMSNLIFFDTNCEFDWMNAIFAIFSDANYALCNWHVNKIVIQNCKKTFDD